MTDQDQARMQLKRYCDLVVANPVFRSITHEDGSHTTFCNEAAQQICEAMSISSFNSSMLANDMYDFMVAHPDLWKRGIGIEAHQHADNGCVAIAARKEAVHGHIAVIYPTTGLADSESLGIKVPFCANVGAVPPHENSICPVTQAFAVALGEPDYFLYIG